MSRVFMQPLDDRGKPVLPKVEAKAVGPNHYYARWDIDKSTIVAKVWVQVEGSNPAIEPLDTMRFLMKGQFFEMKVGAVAQ